MLNTRRTSEDLGRYVARNLIEDLTSGATVDRYTTDQFILYVALADGLSEYKIPGVTEQAETNLWLAENILGAETEIIQNLVKSQGIGYTQ